MMGCGTRLFAERKQNDLEQSRGGGILSILMEEDSRIHIHYPHTSGYKKAKDSMHLAVKQCQLENGDNQKAGKKYPGKVRRSFGNGEMRLRKAYFWPWRYGSSRCKESKLSLAVAALFLLVFGMVLLYTLLLLS